MLQRITDFLPAHPVSDCRPAGRRGAEQRWRIYVCMKGSSIYRVNWSGKSRKLHLTLPPSRTVTRTFRWSRGWPWGGGRPPQSRRLGLVSPCSFFIFTAACLWFSLWFFFEDGVFSRSVCNYQQTLIINFPPPVFFLVLFFYCLLKRIFMHQRSKFSFHWTVLDAMFHSGLSLISQIRN